MIHSMTGYAATSADLGTAALSLEIKAVNSRFLDLGFRLSDELRALEMPMRELITANIQRGKVECRLYLQSRTSGTTELAADEALVAKLQRLQSQIQTLAPDARGLSINEILRWPGVLAEDTLDPEHVQKTALQLLKSALDEFNASRAREGDKLATVLRDISSRMRVWVQQAEPLLPAALVAYRERLAQRLREAVTNLDEDRIGQEIGVFAAKIDVAEELARLNTHLDELERILKAGGPVGKRLDFLMQELNREANTLASKSVSKEITAIALDLKLAIEQMREQVQNLE